MPTILSFDGRNSRELRDAALAALQETAAKFGVSVAPGSGSIDGLKLTLRFEFTVADKDATAAAEAKEFAEQCFLFDLSPHHYRATFTSKGETFELIGFSRSRPKFCLKTRNVATGKVMLFPETVKRLLKIAAAPVEG